MKNIWSRAARAGSRLPAALLILVFPGLAQQPGPAQPVEIRVDARVTEGPFRPLYAWFGYDEPNYTYTTNGKKLIGELAALSPVRVEIRTHHLLVTGDGTAALKWGSTNAYTEDAGGQPVYDWTIVDRIFDTYEQANARPFVEIGFMPEALSSNPQPYTLHWPKADGKGWSYPPKDYGKWAELVRRLVLHSVERYGKAEVESWSWELWNEPDISYWRGTPEEYNRLYDFTADAVKRALPTARVGGPATTGPSAQKAGDYLKQFLEHCARGSNAVTGKRGTPLDFISYHAKGSPNVVEGHVRMGLRKEMADVARGLEIVNQFPEFRALPIVLSEADPEGCAACSARQYPQNLYRNGTMYPSYTAAALGSIIKLADRYKSNVAGMLTWAFEFEDQPYFDGFRTLATNGIDKPVLNLFRMTGLMHGDRVKVESGGAAGLDAILESGVRGAPDIDGLATRASGEMAVLVWNYHDDELPAGPAPIHLALSGIPNAAGRVRVEHFRIDDGHSNAYTAWKQMGSPAQPSPEQYARLESAGQLQLLQSPEWRSPKDGRLELAFPLPRHAVSLVRVSWQ
ncbi:MAG: beta-xylosidase [Acidobacteriia bacterium]|nr:beta-xylosidase [Terriglobia bacterium]